MSFFSFLASSCTLGCDGPTNVGAAHRGLLPSKVGAEGSGSGEANPEVSTGCWVG